MDAADLQKLTTREMPFGKHQGCPIADLPANYLHWFAREGFPPGEIGRLLRTMYSDRSEEPVPPAIQGLIEELQARTEPGDG